MTRDAMNGPERDSELIDLNEHRRRTGRADADPAADPFDAGTVAGTELDIREAGSDLGTARDTAESVAAEHVEYGPDGQPVLVGELVDGPDLPVIGEPVWRTGARTRPILPAWLTSTAELKAAARWTWEYVWRTAAFHAVRVPVYAGKLALRSPRGLWRVTKAVFGWIFDAEGAPVRTNAVMRADAHDYMKLTDRRNDRVRLRLIIAGLGLLAALVAYGVFAVKTPDGAGWALLAAIVAALGMAGGRPDAPLIGRAVVATTAPKLTSDIVIRALGALGIARIGQALSVKGEGITFPAPITRDGPGWRADVDLPYGVTVTDILDRREALASGLRRPVGCVWPEPSHEEHAGRLVLWVGDQDLSKAKPAPWPLAKRGAADLFAPIPFGTDPRGRTVTVLLFENNWLTGSLPGAGKTSGVRVLALSAGLDPTCEVWVFELKGSGDLEACERFAHRYVSGMDDGSIEAALIGLRDLKTEVMRRAAAIKNLPRDVCPEGKLTRQIANRRSLRLAPLVAIFDEVQNMFAHPVYGKEAGELAEFIIKLGRALGVILILATQRPDAASLPTGVSANVSVRFCLRVMGQTENDMVLGTSAYKNGIRATTLRPTDRGIGYLVGAADDPLIVKSAYITPEQAVPIAERARALRIAAGTLTGHAAGEAFDLEASKVSLLEDVLAALPTGEAKVWSEIVCERLADLRPELYGQWGPDQLAAALKPHGIGTVQIGRRVEGKTVNRRGVDRTDILTAIAERNRNRSAD
jgi:S-DNA-T family DNA segregation ATPase FtsK/SpoIIIE